MRIAVVGSGIAGLASAYLLSRDHEVVLFERESRLGGHTHTHDVVQDDKAYRIDTGFIVFNEHNYPQLSKFFAELGVASQPTTMSFSAHDAASGLEYNATNLDGLFCQRKNLFSAKFLRMVREILRFYRQAPALLANDDSGPSLGQYLQAGGYSALFRDAHLIPMASALWSSPSAQILDFPARYLVTFMNHHRMLQINERPQWKVVSGGSSSYIQALQKRWQVDVRLSNPVTAIDRHHDHVQIHSASGIERFDQVILACHSDQALALLTDPSDNERDILGAIVYQPNETVLHTDACVLPRQRKAWAAWNAFIPADPAAPCTVSYCMNLLQSVQSREPFVVTLNRTHAIAPEKILAKMTYHHPLYTHQSVAAQGRRGEINGVQRTWYAGAYWGFGFHEDGMRSAVDVATALGCRW